ncbi:MAG: trypsin-like peptidase domain-containing protein [Chloroflexota bacterium]|nr:trypsin-like peptidase domain-containing protein [Chloroflexota bacterium]
MSAKLFGVVFGLFLIISCTGGTDKIDTLREENRLLRSDVKNLEAVILEYSVSVATSEAELRSSLDSLLSRLDDAQSQLEVMAASDNKTDALTDQINIHYGRIQDQKILIEQQTSVVNAQIESIARIEDAIREIRTVLELQEDKNSNLTEKIEAQREISSGLEKEVAAQKNQDQKLIKQLENLPVNSCKIEDATKAVREVTFKVEIDNFYSSSTGSAFYIGESDFVTNEHVVRGHGSVRLKKDKISYSARVITTDKSRDLALLRIEDSSTMGLPVAVAEISDSDIGMKIGVTGFPKGLGAVSSVTYGVISRVFIQNGIEEIQTDAAISPGSSGGPVFNACGKLVGVITSKLTGTSVEGLGFGVSSDTLSEFLLSAESRGVR